VRAASAGEDALAASIQPKANALEAVALIAVFVGVAQPILTAIGGSAGVSNLAHGRRAGTHAVEAWFMRRKVGIEHPGTLRLIVSIDVNACRCGADAVVLIAAALVHAAAEPRRVEAVAEVALRTVRIQNARYATVDTLAALTGKPEDAIVVLGAPRCRLDATRAFAGYIDASTIGRTVRVVRAEATSGEHALGDPRAVQIIASGLDAQVASRAVLIRVALGTVGARKA
jgi:hypothetical protein